jgi:hypothetical protein
MQALQGCLLIFDHFLLVLDDITVYFNALSEAAKGEAESNCPFDVLGSLSVGVVAIGCVFLDILLDLGELLADEFCLLEQLLQSDRLHHLIIIDSSSFKLAHFIST